MAFYKSKYTGTEIDQRLAQATYDDAVLAGFKGSKEEFDAILGKLKEIADKAENSIQMKSENLDTFNKNIVDAINELHRELQAKPDEQDVIDQGELEVFKDEIAAKYATIDQIPDVSNFVTKEEVPNVFETKGLTELETGESSTNVEAALGIDFTSLIEIIRENKTIIIDRNSAGDYKACIHASGNISSGNGAANLMFFIGTTPTIYQVQYVNGVWALGVDKYEFAEKNEIPSVTNFATKEEVSTATANLVPNTRTVAGKVLDSDITIASSDLTDGDKLTFVYELNGLTDLQEGAGEDKIKAALGVEFEELLAIIQEDKTVIIDRNNVGDYKTCIHATGNISGGNGAINLMFFIGTTPTIYQIQYVSGTFALAVNKYEFAKKSEIPDISNLATKDEIPSLDGYVTTTELETKVDKVEGKQLSTEDYTTEEKEKLSKVNPELISVAVNFPVRTSGGSDGPEDRIYTQEEILEWFGVADIAALKKQISVGGIQYVKYGIMLMGNPYYYKMPVQYAAFESANQIKLVFTGLNTNNDVVSKYEIIANLDGTIIEGNSNVKMTVTSIESKDIDLSTYTTKEELNDYALKSELPDVSNLATKSEVTEGLADKANVNHTHEISNITGLQDALDSISDPYEINLTNLLSAEDSESISAIIGGIDNLNATVQDNRIIVGTISNGNVSVSIRILGNVTTLYYLLDSVVGLTLNEVAITNTSGTLSKSVTTHSVLTENMVINSLESDEATLPLSAAQGKVLATDKQNKTDNNLSTTDKTIVGAINELLTKVQELEAKNTELESRLAALEGTN